MFFDWNRFIHWGRQHFHHWPHWPPKPKPPVKPPTVLSAYIKFGGVKVTKFMINDKQTGEVVATIIDAVGNPATLPAGVTWTWATSNSAIATVATDPSDPTGLSGIVTPSAVAGNLGTCTITGSSSDGLAIASVQCQVVGSAAVSANITLTPVNAPAAVVAPTSTTPVKA